MTDKLPLFGGLDSMVHKKAGGEAEILHQYISKAIERNFTKEMEYDFSTTHDSAFT